MSAGRSPAAAAPARARGTAQASAPARAPGPLLEVVPAPLPGWRAERCRGAGRRRWGLVVAAAVLAAALGAGLGDGPLVNAAGWPEARAFLAAAVHPRLDAGFLSLTLDAALTTLAYAVLGTALSLVLGLVGGVLGAQAWWRTAAVPARARRRLARWRVGWLGTRAALALPRGVHEVVWGLLLLNVLGVDPLVAVLAIGLPYGAVTAKVLSELLDEAASGPFAALRARGASRTSALAYGLLPLALPDLLSYAFYRFECSIRAAAVLGIVGAGGLGFQIAISFQELHFEEMWTLIYALLLLSGLADLWSTRIRARRVRGATRAAGGGARRDGAPRRDRLLAGSLLAGLGLVALSAWHLGLSPGALVGERARQQLGLLVGAALPPDFASTGAHQLLALSAQTLAMATLAAAFAGVGGLVAAWLGADLGALVDPERARGWRRGPELLRVLAVRAVLLALRAIPPPVWALLCLFVLYPGVLPGAAALGLYALGIVGRLDTEAVDDQDPRPARALRRLGASRGQVLAYAVTPLAASRFAAFAVYRWEVAVRETVVVGAVGAGGLGELLKQQLDRFDYPGVTATLVVLVALTLLVDLVGAGLRRATR